MKTTIRQITASIATMILAAAAVGCAHDPHPEPTRHIPRPVTESGDTLLWGRDVKSAALRLIEHSRRYCYVDMYELSDPDIIRALQSAKARAVHVEVVLDATEKHSQTIGVPKLKHIGVLTKSLRIHRGISHIKMIVTDSAVLIGGMNFGENSWANNDASVVIPHPNGSFLALFRWDWQRAGEVPAAAPAYRPPLFNDRDAERQVVTAIHKAKHAVYLEAFDLSDWPVVEALKQAAQRGIIVEVLLDPGQYQNRKSAADLRDVGATVRFYRPYQSEWMHAKILDVDNGATFIIGSANFSHQAYTYNHEGDIELHHVPLFDKSLQDDLSLQISRGTDYPIPQKHSPFP